MWNNLLKFPPTWCSRYWDIGIRITVYFSRPGVRYIVIRRKTTNSFFCSIGFCLGVFWPGSYILHSPGVDSKTRLSRDAWHWTISDVHYPATNAAGCSPLSPSDHRSSYLFSFILWPFGGAVPVIQLLRLTHHVHSSPPGRRHDQRKLVSNRPRAIHCDVISASLPFPVAVVASSAWQ